jgi:glycine/D-amino acid oxidase-like deaminating enzyme
MTADHLPKILRLGDNAYAAFGYSGRGIGPGTVFGKALAKFLLQKDADVLPVPPLDAHSERFNVPKQVYYETGCALTHLVADRV